MKLQPKEYLKYARLINVNDKTYDVNSESLQVKEFLKQPVWQILPSVEQYYFPPFFIVSTNCYKYIKIENKFLIFKSAVTGFLTKYLTYESPNTIDFLKSNVIIFDSIEHALEYLSPNTIDNIQDFILKLP